MNPEYAGEISFHEVNLAPTDERAFDLDFTNETSMWEWYGNIMACLGNMTIFMAEEQPQDFRVPFLKLPFKYDLSELGNE